MDKAIDKEELFKYLDTSNFNLGNIENFKVHEIHEMFLNEEDPMIPELAYYSFLLRSYWGENFDFEYGVSRVNMQLRLPLFEGEGLSWKLQKLDPSKIWASEDSLDYDKYQMVLTGLKYMLKHNKRIPPVVVWSIKTDPRYSWVVHDGHHRIYAFYELKMPVEAIVLEYWIDNRENPLLPKKLHYEKIDMRIVDMPIEKFEKIAY